MLFDNIMKTPQAIGEWTLTLFNLLSSGIIPPMECGGVMNTLFTDVMDMVVILMQKIQVNESSNQIQGQPHQPLPNDVIRFSAVIRKMRVSPACKIFHVLSFILVFYVTIKL